MLLARREEMAPLGGSKRRQHEHVGGGGAGAAAVAPDQIAAVWRP
ncbi:MAG TPA: hypothetical protein VMF57_14105 [Solirubrobacteraceae bacterium]|nr:hypothetical protein [Solirubrobacteraceae bacterium]